MMMPASVDDVDDETGGKNRNHDGHDRQRHEIAAFLEEAVKPVVVACERVNDGEQVNSHVKQQEDYKKCSADSLDELPSDGIVKCVRHYRLISFYCCVAGVGHDPTTSGL